MKFFLEKHMSGDWVGATDEDHLSFKRLISRMEKAQHGASLRVEVKRPRNLAHHRKGMALVNYIFENQDKYNHRHDLLVELKIRCGHYEEHITLNGEVIYQAKSIAFSEMGQDEFDALYEKMVQAAIDHFLPIMSNGDKEKHLENIVRF